MPKIAEIEYTPNPNAVKFVLKEAVAIGFPRSFPDRAAAEADPLAQALFDVGDVVSVFMQDRWLTVTKTPEKPWSELLPRLAPPIRSAPSAGGSAAAGPIPSRPLADTIADDELLQRVRAALEETIMPALAADGGGLEVVGRQDRRILIRYQGACSTCPAGLGGTLMAIEAIIQRDVDPELTVLTV